MKSQTDSTDAFVSYGITHQGKVRENNEDAIFDLKSQGLWGVADGAGGHAKGEVASQLIIEELSKFECHTNLSSNVEWIVSKLREVNQTLIDMRENLTDGGLIGSTVSALLIHKGYSVCIWSGDSRIYLLRNETLFLLTQDHNRKEEFFSAGFSEKELQNYPIANQLTKAIGATTPLSLDVQLYEAKVGDLYLLCSDGLSGELERNGIKNIMSGRSDAKETAEKLIDSVLQSQAKDNISVVVVLYQQA